MPCHDAARDSRAADLICRIGEWVIDTACREAARWHQPWRVAVNVSPSQFRRSDVARIVEAALKRTGLSAGRLVVEITEGVFIQDTANAVSVLSQLRAQGIRLVLDDFGTGYSSLSYLQLFKFDKMQGYCSAARSRLKACCRPALRLCSSRAARCRG